MKWSGSSPGPGDVGHAVVGVDEGVFIGTAGAHDKYGVYLSSAAQEYKKYYGTQQLSIYEVQGIDAGQRQRAAAYALEQYGTGYSYAGVVTGHRESETDNKWYCSELTVAALERGDVTFYEGNGVLYKDVRYPTLPTLMSGYRTQIGDSSPRVTTRWATAPLLQTWPPR